MVSTALEGLIEASDGFISFTLNEHLHSVSVDDWLCAFRTA